MLERIPWIIRRFLGLRRPHGGIGSLCVEIDAVRSGVIEYPVEQNGNSPLRCGAHKRQQCLVPAEHPVDMQIIRRIVTVIRRRLENRIEIETGYTERRKIIELLCDSCKVAAVKHIVLFVFQPVAEI